MKNLTLNVILSSTEEKIGQVEMRAERFAKLEAFGDHENKPMNLILNENEIEALKAEIEEFSDPAFNNPFTDDDDIRLEVA